MYRFVFTLSLLLVSSVGLHAQSGTTGRSGNSITCASDDGKRHTCAVNTRGGVQMANQRSGSPCIQGQTWGTNRRGVWVDRGCRADFVVGGGYNGGGQRDRDDRDGQGQRGRSVTCSSDNGKRNYCKGDTRGGVQMVRQRSGSACIQNQTWGYDDGAIWVDRGCRADFIVGGR